MIQAEVDEELLRRLDKAAEHFARTEKAKERAAQLAWCERMERKGKAP